MGSMAPNKYLIFIDMEYLAKRNDLADELFKFMESNYRTARIFLRGKSKGTLYENKILRILLTTVQNQYHHTTARHMRHGGTQQFRALVCPMCCVCACECEGKGV